MQCNQHLNVTPAVRASFGAAQDARHDPTALAQKLLRQGRTRRAVGCQAGGEIFQVANRDSIEPQVGGLLSEAEATSRNNLTLLMKVLSEQSERNVLCKKAPLAQQTRTQVEE